MTEKIATTPIARPSDSADWIVAPATAPGTAAIAMVRLDGPGCWSAAARVWKPNPTRADADSLEPPSPRRLTLGIIHDRLGNEIDQIVLARFQGPHSYTGNDLVEFHCHGSAALVNALLEALQQAGCRLARPGEFTERAFFNGRMDLAQAEAVAALIASRTQAASRAALAQLQGGLSVQVAAIREIIVDFGAEVEARLDFPDEEIPPAKIGRLHRQLQEALQRLERLIGGARRGRLLCDGARIAIAGKPNTGKSSLFNVLVGRERALVTPHPGTTRDTIEATIDLQGIPVLLVDTAGVRHEEAGEIERLGIDRSLREIEQADLVLLVIDGSAPPTPEDVRLFQTIENRPYLLVANKSDLPAGLEDGQLLKNLATPDFELRTSNFEIPPPLHVSALRGEALDRLESAIVEHLAGPQATADRETVLVTCLRHEEQLRLATEALRRAEHAFLNGLSGEFVMADIQEALHALCAILGLSLDDAILTRIFSRFCIGK